MSNYLRLLKLPDEVQLALKEGLISMGHAKAIAGAPADQQLRVLKRCIKKGLSVRQVEELVRSLSEAPGKEAQNVEDWSSSSKSSFRRKFRSNARKTAAAKSSSASRTTATSNSSSNVSLNAPN